VQSLELHEPATLPEAVGLLGQVGAKDKIVPGGSDLMAGVKKDWIAGKGFMVETTQQLRTRPETAGRGDTLLERLSQSQPWSPRRDWNSVRVAARVSATVPSHALHGHLPFSSCHRIR
jgi:hypothetical protein